MQGFYPLPTVDTTTQRQPEATHHQVRATYGQDDPFLVDPFADLPLLPAKQTHPTLPGLPGDLIVSPAVPPTDFIYSDIIAPTHLDPPVASSRNQKMGDPRYCHPMSMSAIIDA
ncbi:hypothetical protein JCM6882_009667 [Rhodosporidiobolus microsporus]